MMNLSQVGLNLIKSFEGCVLTSYMDVGGVWTIGYGHTANVRQFETITQAQADAFLSQDVGWAVDCVNNSVKVPLNQYQFDALVSFVFNVGASAFEQSTLLQLLNEKRYSDAANQFMLWVHAGGQVVQGLVNRRKAEQSLFNRPVETPVYTQKYRVNPGENLTEIAVKFHTTVTTLLKMNPNIKDENLIQIGQILVVPK